MSPKPQQPDAPKKPAFGPDGLTDNDRAIIREAIARYPEIERVTLFGSRAMGSFGRGSDIDLALEGPKITAATRAKLAADLEDSNLPYKVDLLIRNKKLDKAVEKHIRRYGKPFDWEEMALSDAVQVNPSVDLEKNTEYPFVEMAAVEPSRPTVGPSELRHFTGGGSKFEVGDTLFARITPCLENGKIARFRNDNGTQKGHGSTEFIVLRGKDACTTSDFTFYLAKSPAVRQYAVGKMTGSSGRQRVPTDALDYLTVQIPKLDEQRAIAGVLGSLDDKIEQNRRTAGKLEELARAVFRAWFVDFAPVHAKANGATTSGGYPGLPQPAFDALPTNFTPAPGTNSPLGPIPEGWEVKRLGDVLKLHYGKSLTKTARTPGPVPVYGSGGINGTHNAALVNGPGIIVGRKGSVGTIYWEEADFYPIDTVFYVEPTSHLSLHYLYELLCTLGLEGMNTDAAVPGLNRDNACRLEVVVPPVPLAEAMNNFLASLRSYTSHIKTESQKLAELRDYLLPRLLSGAVRVSGGREAEAITEGVGR